MKQFVPMTDEMLYQAAFRKLPLIPYQVGLNCLHGLKEAEKEKVFEAIEPESSWKNEKTTSQ